MQSSNEHKDKINSEHASPTPQVNAQTHSYTHSFLHPLLNKHTHHLPALLTKGIQTHSFHRSALYDFTVYFFVSPLSLSLFLLKMRRKDKSKGSKRPKMAPQNKKLFFFFFTLPGYNEFFKTSHLQMCRGIDRPSHCKVSHCIESISAALYLFTEVFTLLVALPVVQQDRDAGSWVHTYMNSMFVCIPSFFEKLQNKKKQIFIPLRNWIFILFFKINIHSISRWVHALQSQIWMLASWEVNYTKCIGISWVLGVLHVLYCSGLSLESGQQYSGRLCPPWEARQHMALSPREQHTTQAAWQPQNVCVCLCVSMHVWVCVKVSEGAYSMCMFAEDETGKMPAKCLWLAEELNWGCMENVFFFHSHKLNRHSTWQTFARL